MRTRLRYLIPIGVGILGVAFLAAVYFGIVSWAESPEHALNLFWEDRRLVIPILLGFGVQAGLYSVLKLRLYMPIASSAVRTSTAPAASMGAGGTTSTVAMVACCAHHVADVLPILGLTAAATFLAKYQTAFMIAGLITNSIGISVIAVTIYQARKKAFLSIAVPQFIVEEK